MGDGKRRKALNFTQGRGVVESVRASTSRGGGGDAACAATSSPTGGCSGAPLRPQPQEPTPEHRQRQQRCAGLQKSIVEWCALSNAGSKPQMEHFVAVVQRMAFEHIRLATQEDDGPIKALGCLPGCCGVSFFDKGAHKGKPNLYVFVISNEYVLRSPSCTRMGGTDRKAPFGSVCDSCWQARNLLKELMVSAMRPAEDIIGSKVNKIV